MLPPFAISLVEVAFLVPPGMDHGGSSTFADRFIASKVGAGMQAFLMRLPQSEVLVISNGERKPIADSAPLRTELAQSYPDVGIAFVVADAPGIARVSAFAVRAEFAAAAVAAMKAIAGWDESEQFSITVDTALVRVRLERRDHTWFAIVT